MDAGAIVEQLRAARSEEEREAVLAPLYAEQVDFRHEPPLDSDGLVSGESLAAVGAAERAAFRLAMPDHTTTASYEVEGDVILGTMRMRGTLPDGSTLDHVVDVRYTVQDGSITGLAATFDATQAARIGAALMASGFRLPEPDHEA